MEITIDKEFKDMIPPLSTSELETLKASILSEGCRDSVIVWSDGNILIDGHNRYKICTEHNLPFQVAYREFKDRESAENWIDSNQLGRRNATPDQLSIIRGRLYNRLKKQGERTDLTLGHIGTKLNTAEALAANHGVSERTIKRDGVTQAIIHQFPEKEREVISGEKKKAEVLKEIAPQAKPEAKPETPQEETVTILKDAYDELLAIVDSNQAEAEALEKVVDGNFMIQDAIDTINKQVEQLRLMKCGLDGANNKNNELIKLVKSKDRQIAKLEKEALGMKQRINDLESEVLPL